MNEIKNQIAHFLISALIAIVFVFIPMPWTIILSGFMAGIIVEICQFIYRDNKELRLADRLLDLTFWIIGSSVVMIIYVYFS